MLLHKYIMTQILMIKKCGITGLKYLCKCSGNVDPYKYHGSGKRWINHLKKYHKNWSRSKNIDTVILGTYETKKALKEAGIFFSEFFNIVESQDWANIIPESGDGGWVHDQTGNTWKISDTSKMRNSKTITDAVIKARQSISAENNHQFEGYYITPYGKFVSLREAVTKAKELQSLGRKDVLLSESIVKKYCRTENTKILNPEGRRTYPAWRGKTPQEIGFGFIEKD
jgi:hypothetical protein